MMDKKNHSKLSIKETYKVNIDSFLNIISKDILSTRYPIVNREVP
jgi:hypothetical protein